MLEILNPCNDPNAWWQHLLMLGIPFLLGLLWPKGVTDTEVEDENAIARLASLDAELAECKSKTKSIETIISSKSTITDTNLTLDENIGATSFETGAVKSKKDDLKVVEGIGPKIEELFNNAGIYTFGQLASTPSSKLKEILVAAGSRYQMHDPTTWPAQSKLAYEGKWEELKKWQDELNKGIS